MARAHARHILVSSEDEARELMAEIEEGGDFAALAEEHSSCPSSANGGDLGEFGQGDMVESFDEAVFDGDVGEILGPVKTSFGYHVIEVLSRDD